ncbi:ribbon-helix-helix CopG family protein [Blastococcus colisei]|uniref:Ribbon-helix-helix CopG family protein n=1 Tax=Blastococcus colisei TaxID=1564162 RepID=A0A543PDE6_9ACTN|nr:ribbon-helix-helix protein, CopG family [Blastococcus colisei]TQN42105.1 ribbon-helix-helix CopG family protein [Blastococcus colisei]
MKLSISLSDEDVAFVDEYVAASGLESRSAAIRRALHLLRQPQLEQDYERAWEEWAASGEQAAWDTTAGDGVADAPR